MTTKNFKPMLLSNDEFDLHKLDYTEMFGSKKRDGVRAEVTNKGILGRSLKPLRNINIQNWFKEIYEKLPNYITLEAEIHSNSLPCREIAGICNSEDKDVPEDIKLYIFGIFNDIYNFSERILLLEKVIKDHNIRSNKFEIIPQYKILSAVAAQSFYNSVIKEGFEGIILMDGRKKYKQGRVTINQHIGFKMKPTAEIDLPIIGVTERELNLNESQKNELGESFKRNTVDAKEKTGIAACFICKLPNGETTKITISGNENFRKDIWENKDSYIGKYAVIKSMDYGTKDKLRHARLLDIKDAEEK